MKVAFDHQIFMLQAYGGISRYFVRLAEGLVEKTVDARIFAPIHGNQYLKGVPEEIARGRFIKHLPPKSVRLSGYVNRHLCGRAVQKFSPSILHETYYTKTPVASHGAARVLTVYDMIHEKFADTFPPRDRTSMHKRAAVERADHIISISHSTKRDLCEVFNVSPAKVSVVHLGFEEFRVSDDSDMSVANGRPYLLFVGSRGGYKNFEGMLRAVASRKELLNAIDVIAFGAGPFTALESDLIKSLGFRPGTVRQYFGSDAVLGQLYRNARAFVYPSLYEGFGLPPLEAMAHDCPVISSDSSSMPEVIGTAGEYFTPSDIDHQAQAICSVVFDTARRDSLIQLGKKQLRQFSWESCANETVSAYQKV